MPYHRTSCFVRGFARACKAYNLGKNCYGGEQRLCDVYVKMLRANTACALDKDPSACNYLQQLIPTL